MTAEHPPLPPDDRDERSATDLDDEADRDELRQRYYGLLQELRVLLPGTQVLVAFLLAVPFNIRFVELDTTGEALYALALCTGAAAIICLIAPTAFHRFGPRRARAVRLVWSIRLLRAGLVLLGASLASALTVVTLLVFGGGAAVACATVTTAVLLGVWVALPLATMAPRHGNGTDER